VDETRGLAAKPSSKERVRDLRSGQLSGEPSEILIEQTILR
jgi:hypothetical protein